LVGKRFRELAPGATRRILPLFPRPRRIPQVARCRFNPIVTAEGGRSRLAMEKLAAADDDDDDDDNGRGRSSRTRRNEERRSGSSVELFSAASSDTDRD